ncbi:VOC family protein [Nocardioides pantholopis]|uniref:VOC family protein n=1 Tax=Nocardioides pantholopis TaxID=2483798 RepID=UPI000F0916EC|nr:VOC family protein [Nocardioides pantholopis]
MRVDHHSPGNPCWIELFTPDPAAARTFYADLFGWEAGEASEEFGGYFMFFHDGAPVAGCMDNDGGRMGPAAWSVYLHTDDVAASLTRAAKNGATVEAGPMQIGDVGHMGFLTDPTGAGIGLWQPLAHPGFVARAEDGAPGWFELSTGDYPAALAFYRDTFDWDLHTLSDTDDFRYTTYGEDEAAYAGIEAATGLGEPDQWRLYIQVDDTDEATRKALAAGGTQTLAPEDTPYGRCAGLRDPAGVPFLLMGPNREG